MSFAVIWSPSASEELASLLEYLEKEWGTESALTFLDNIDKVVAEIQEFPEMFPASRKKNIRKAVVSRYTSILYRVESKDLQILHVWDNRRDPEALEELLK